MELFDGGTAILAMIGAILVALFTIGMILAKLYCRASKEVSFVRTGMGGQRVIMNGGALVLPVLHETIPVNMNTLRLEVRRHNEAALITKDRMRVDVQAEFYVRVKPTTEAIADAAQTLGRKTMNPSQLRDLVEGKFVDALRAVAAEMGMEELHEQRVDFVQKVQRAVSEDLLKNGLELETVSLTGLDQTSREFFNPQNAFDASGLTKLTEEIESRRKQRNDIEQDTAVMIADKNLEAEKKTLEIRKLEEYARLEQQREVEVRRAQQAANIASEQAEKDREAQEARIVAKRSVDMAAIEAERQVEEQRIEKERRLREADILRERSVETADVDKVKTIELARQDQAIAIAEKSKSQSVAEAEADKARAEAVKAHEKVMTARESERAEREKLIELVEARKQAERDAISITVAAEAEKQAAVDKAEARRTEAQGQSDQHRIVAEGEANAEVLRAEAAEKRYQVDADGTRKRHEADNLLSMDQIQMQIKLALIQNLSEIVRESVRPIEAIEGIKIYQVEGLGGAGTGYGGSGGSGDNAGGNLADQVVNSALRYRAQAPLLDALMEEVGLDPSDINGLTAPLRDAGITNGSGGNGIGSRDGDTKKGA